MNCSEKLLLMLITLKELTLKKKLILDFGKIIYCFDTSSSLMI